MPLGTGVPTLAVGSQLAHSERPRIIDQTLTAPAIIGRGELKELKPWVLRQFCGGTQLTGHDLGEGASSLKP